MPDNVEFGYFSSGSPVFGLLTSSGNRLVPVVKFLQNCSLPKLKLSNEVKLVILIMKKINSFFMPVSAARRDVNLR